MTTTTTKTFTVTRTGGATYRTDATQTDPYESPIHEGDTLVESASTTYTVLTEPVVSGYETKWARVRDNNTGNEFCMNFTHGWKAA